MFLLHPNLEKYSDVLDDSKERNNDWMEDRYPWLYVQLDIEHQNSEDVSHEHKYVVINFLLLVDVFSDQFCGFKASGSYNLIIVPFELLFYLV